MQPRGPLPEENMFVAVQRDNLPPPRVTTAMNIGRGRATGTRSRKKSKNYNRQAACCSSGTTRKRGRGGRRGHGNYEDAEVPEQPQEL